MPGQFWLLLSVVLGISLFFENIYLGLSKVNTDLKEYDFCILIPMCFSFQLP